MNPTATTQQALYTEYQNLKRANDPRAAEVLAAWTDLVAELSAR